MRKLPKVALRAAWTRTVARVLCALAVVALVGCDGSRDREAAPSIATRTLVADDATLGNQWSSSRLEEDAEGTFVAEAWHRATKPQGMTLGVRTPPRANGAIDVGLATTQEITARASGDFVVHVTHENAAPAPVTKDDGRATYHDVLASTDLVVTATASRVEWFYVLRDTKAKAQIAMHLDLPPGLRHTKEEKSGALAFLDAQGRRRLRMEAPFAIDARGVHRDATLGWDEATAHLVLTLDTQGLAFPIVLDPSVAVPIWERAGVSGASIPSSTEAGMAYDSARDRTVLFGGSLGNETWEWDGTTWTQRAVAVSPAAREYPAMAYDSARGKTVLFGGSDSSAYYDSDTWEWDGTTWTERFSVATPPGRLGAQMVYDSARGTMVLYGGAGIVGNSDVTMSDTWEWDGGSWTQRTPASSPGGRLYAAMSYDIGRKKSVLFGGYYESDTWEWDGTNWAYRSVATHPSARSNATMIYDATRNKSVLFGGYNGTYSSSGYLADTWTWDGTTWAQLAPTTSPSARADASMVYDSNHQKSLLLGGDNFNGNLGDQWFWNGTNWSGDTSNVTTPAPRSCSMVFDSVRGKSVIYGGQGSTGDFSDTWEWNGSLWSQISTTGSPGARHDFGFAYDSTRQVSLLFGGYLTQQVADTWQWDGTTWTELAPATAPSARSGSALAHDSRRGKTVLFGGINAQTYLAETWEWDGTTWTQRTPASAPSIRMYAQLAYDSGRGETVLFGGYKSGGEFGDTWEWDGTTWTQRLPTSTPGARYGAGFAYDAIRGRSVLYGGANSYGFLDGDTWEWDGTNWQLESTASPSARAGAGMAYDSTRGEVVLFGGNDGGSSETWLYFSVGASCTTTSTCDLGFCTDGVCCNASQCGTCQACNLVGSGGLCSNVAAGSTDPDSCTSPNVCTEAGRCGAPLGAVCAANADCASNFCVDGVCCNTACDGDCQGCSAKRGLSQDGTCAFAPQGTAGRTTCANHFLCDGQTPSCPGACVDDLDCAAGYYCGASGTCVAQKAQGASCNLSAGVDCLTANCRECAAVGSATSGHCVDDVCCDTACDGACGTCGAAGSIGTCSPVASGSAGSPSCAPYLCTGTSDVCGSTCASNADCVALATCDPKSHQCVGTASLGSACTSDAACASKACVGGICCQSSCSIVPSDGGTPSICQIGECTKDVFACQLPAGDTVCGPNTCLGNTQYFIAACQGDGTCGQVLTKECSPYTCGGAECKTSCTTSADCDTAHGAQCDSSTMTCVFGSVCSTDGSSVVSSTGTTDGGASLVASVSCAPYLCVAGACTTKCSSVADCAAGNSCDPAGACVAKAADVAMASGGCSCEITRREASRSGSLLASALVLVGLLRRTRRRERSFGARRVFALVGIFAGAALVLGCSRRETSISDTVNRITSMSDELSTRFKTEPFENDGRGGSIAHAWTPSADHPKSQGLTLGAALPATADAPMTVGLATPDEIAAARSSSPGATTGDYLLRITHESAARVPLARDGEHGSYRAIAPSTDLLVSATPKAVEWFYLLHDPSAPTTFAAHLDLPAGLPRAKVDGTGALVFFDTRGKARLQMTKPFAVDARGERRDATLTWEPASHRVVIALDAHDLAFPVVIDPAIEEPVWQQVASVSPLAARSNAATAYDSVRGRTIVFGGQGTNTIYGDTWEWDGTQWTQMASAVSPSVRWGAAMAYDSARDRAVMFGGYSGQNGVSWLDETWEWDGTSWTLRAASNPPSPRANAAMVYDTDRGVSILFGGSGSQAMGDTWEWDGNGWTQHTPASAPSARASAAMAYDSGRYKTVLFGGGNLADTWEYDGTTWTQRTAASAPPGRTGAAMAYDIARATTLLFGGTHNFSAVADTWEWDGTAWTQLAPTTSPSARASASIAYDSAREKTVLFGGVSTGYDNDLWEWDGTRWTGREIVSAPSSRSYGAMVYDSAHALTVLFSGGTGYQSNFKSDQWAWDGTIWTQVSPATLPPARTNAAFTYDSAHGMMLVVGGAGASSLLGDTWGWDGTSWTELSTTGPSARRSAAMAYDAARSRAILFGGYPPGGTPALGDTWSWDGTTWTQPSTITSVPTARFGATMAFDSKRAITVLFAGHYYGMYNDQLDDTWEWDGTNWTQRTPALTPFVREGAGMTYDPVRGKTIVFGGYGYSGELNDTWEWDGTNWTAPSAPPPPARDGLVFVHDTARGTNVMFGGYISVSASTLGDTWLYYTVGAACTTTSTCDLGFCTDGLCCNQAQCGTCQACNVAGHEGTCTDVPANTADPDTCTAPNTCTASGSCGAPAGTSCTGNSQCASSFCVDGVCCDTACDGDCQACSGARGLAQGGTCSFAPAGIGGRNACATGYECNGMSSDCPATCVSDDTCASDFYCNASGACVAQKTQGATCNLAAGADCLGANCRECGPIGSAPSGQCVDGVCCDSACDGTCDQCNLAGSLGTCSTSPEGSSGSPSCAPFTCGGDSTACATTCASDSDCSPLAYCDVTSHRCVGTAPLGTACTSDDRCASHACVSGICCQSSCGASAPSIDGGAASVCQVGTCSTETFACQLPNASTICNADTCVNGTQHFIAVCQGNGKCGEVLTKDCAPYICGATECKTSCTSDTDCVGGTTCVGGLCVVHASCSTDRTSVVSIDGVVTPCAPYFCQNNACMTTCSSVVDCVSGYVCSTQKVCVASAATTIAPSNGGCSCELVHRRKSEAGAFGILGIAAAAIARRRKRGPRSARRR